MKLFVFNNYDLPRGIELDKKKWESGRSWGPQHPMEAELFHDGVKVIVIDRLDHLPPMPWRVVEKWEIYKGAREYIDRAGYLRSAVNMMWISRYLDCDVLEANKKLVEYYYKCLT